MPAGTGIVVSNGVLALTAARISRHCFTRLSVNAANPQSQTPTSNGAIHWNCPDTPTIAGGSSTVSANCELKSRTPGDATTDLNAAGACCGPAAEDGVDDVGFIKAMVARLTRALPLDEERIYVAGMSNGGVLAYALACRTSLLAAIGVVAGTQVGRCDEPRPMSVLHVHGLADTMVRFDGGPAVVPGALPVPRVLV